jgi:hypothetical protein
MSLDDLHTIPIFIGKDSRILAHVVRVERNRSFPNAVLVFVECPICGKIHQHGERGDWDGRPSGREPHCMPPANRYRIGYAVCLNNFPPKGRGINKLLPKAFERICREQKL